MNKELIQQYQTFRNTNAVQSIEIVTSAGRLTITNKPMKNKIMDFIIDELRKEEMYEESRKDNF